MAMPEITVVIAIDKATIEQLRVSWRTWRKNRKQLWTWPWLIVYDSLAFKHDDMLALADTMGLPAAADLVPWNPAQQYDSQRERMLSAHVFAPATHAKTPYYMKLDTDALAHDGAPVWPDPEWFAEKPAIIGPRWHYSKGKNFLGLLEDWGDKALREHPKLGCKEWPNYSPDAMRVGHARFCSWLSFYRLDFAKHAARLCWDTLGPNKLPVPSQDTTHWYIAERTKESIVIAGQKNRGWNNHSRLEELKRVASEIMQR